MIVCWCSHYQARHVTNDSHRSTVPPWKVGAERTEDRSSTVKPNGEARCTPVRIQIARSTKIEDKGAA